MSSEVVIPASSNIITSMGTFFSNEPYGEVRAKMMDDASFVEISTLYLDGEARSALYNKHAILTAGPVPASEQFGYLRFSDDNE